MVACVHGHLCWHFLFEAGSSEQCSCSRILLPKSKVEKEWGKKLHRPEFKTPDIPYHCVALGILLNLSLIFSLLKIDQLNPPWRVDGGLKENLQRVSGTYRGGVVLFVRLGKVLQRGGVILFLFLNLTSNFLLTIVAFLDSFLQALRKLHVALPEECICLQACPLPAHLPASYLMNHQKAALRREMLNLIHF